MPYEMTTETPPSPTTSNLVLEISPKEMVGDPVPELNVGIYHDTSAALPYLDFKGELQPWPAFLSAVQTIHESHAWQDACLGFRDPETLVPDTMGNLEIAWERGLKGRFHKYFGDDLNATFKSQSMGIRFAAFACAKSTYSGPIDVIMKDDDHNVKVVGELRVPWVPEHSIEDRLEFGSDLKKTLALPILYMQQLWCVYGFLSTYDETIFLRQVVGSQGVWWIKYSPVILASITYDKGDAKDYLVVSTKQCFFYMGCEALNQGPVNNTTAGWVQRH